MKGGNSIEFVTDNDATYTLVYDELEEILWNTDAVDECKRL